MKRVITAQDVPASGELRVPIGSVVTPSAREAAHERGVRIKEAPEGELAGTPPRRMVAMGADHGGFRMKEALKPVVESWGERRR